MHRLLAVVLLPGCLSFDSDAPASGVWLLELGIPEQVVKTQALGVTDRDAWLQSRPRVVLDAGGATIAVMFQAGPNPDELLLEGLFDSRDELIITRTHDPDSASGLDHNVSWNIEVNDDDAQQRHTFVAADLVGDPGCGGDRQPTSVSTFDGDRAAIPWDGERLDVGGIQVAMVIGAHDCIVVQ